MKFITGNLITLAQQGQFDIIVHGCNCHGVMGGGIARAIRDTWPAVYRADLAATTRDRSMLGSYSTAVFIVGDKDLRIINAYTQFGISHGDDVFEYEAFERVLERIAIDYPDATIGMPLIGCGLAGGDKERILGIIESAPNTDNITVVVFG